MENTQIIMTLCIAAAINFSNISVSDLPLCSFKLFKLSTVSGLNRKVLDTFLLSNDFDLLSRNRMKNQGIIFSIDMP